MRGVLRFWVVLPVALLGRAQAAGSIPVENYFGGLPQFGVAMRRGLESEVHPTLPSPPAEREPFGGGLPQFGVALRRGFEPEVHPTLPSPPAEREPFGGGLPQFGVATRGGFESEVHVGSDGSQNVTPVAQGTAQVQDAPRLSLSEALRLAKERNGTVRAAQYDAHAAAARQEQAAASFFPTVTPNYTYTSAREQFQVGLGTSFLQTEGNATAVNASWTVLDSGEREYGFLASTRLLSAQRYTARQTLRTVLFDVTQQYYDTLRAQELEQVSDTQVSRAAEILRATELRITVGDAAKLERLQANADLLNAKVQALTAQNQASNSVATLKATIGFDRREPLPPLVKDPSSLPTEFSYSLPALIDEGLSKRPDLQSLRKSVEGARFSELRADRQASVTMSLDAVYDDQLSPINLQDRSLVLTVSYPLFDGGLLRGLAREQAANVNSQRASLLQAERAARAEIEAAYAELRQNTERLIAAKAANDAAQENYNAAIGAQVAGANGLLDVLTAQLSLDTAESDYIQALYDYKISAVNLNLVTGRAIPGE